MAADFERLKHHKNFIGGQWVDAASGGTIDVVNPATMGSIGTVPNGEKQDAQAAVDAAADAFETFRHSGVTQRVQLLRDLHSALMDNQNELAHLLVEEQGKPLAEAKGEIANSAGYTLWFAEEARRAYGETIPSPWPDRRISVITQPVGVIAAITPWNFPSAMLARKIAPAIAVGCTAVCKPSELTPFSGLAWAALCEEVGVPAGVVNVLTGDAEAIGKVWSADGRVRKMTFTGSTRVGKILLQQGAETVKKMSMELGGNAPFIVFDDADLDKAIEAGMAAKYRNAGQTCVCTNRFYVQAGVYDAFVEKLVAASEKLTAGNNLEGAHDQGPLINEQALSKVTELVEDARAQGGDVKTGGARMDRDGVFFRPTVVANATQNMRIAKEEVFGPVAPVFKFETEAEAIAMANDTDFGLAAYFCTSDLGRSVRVSEALDYGLVGVNEGVIATPEAPFGGFKQSGLGREGSRHGLDEYLERKYVCTGGLGL
ncbi:MAG: NAD-dependent succinate-semialdehyde dehydrogenase [Pseudomonadota bacterium]